MKEGHLPDTPGTSMPKYKENLFKNEYICGTCGEVRN